MTWTEERANRVMQVMGFIVGWYPAFLPAPKAGDVWDSAREFNSLIGDHEQLPGPLVVLGSATYTDLVRQFEILGQLPPSLPDARTFHLVRLKAE